MNGAGLTTGSIAGSGASGSGRIMRAEASVHSKLVVGGFRVITTYLQNSYFEIHERICSYAVLSFNNVAHL